VTAKRDPPREATPAEVFRGSGSVDVVAPSSPDPALDWQQYLDEPSADRIGIACSGGGIRSASYCLGALQELRRRGLLNDAEYLSCVSGGGYITIAHEVLVSETDHARWEDPETPPAPDPFASMAPYAIGSPEERHVRNHLDYIAPGLTGRIWLLFNLLGGLARHLLPFVAVLCIAAWLTGMALTRWVEPSIRCGADMPDSPCEPASEAEQLHLAPFGRMIGLLLLLSLVFLVVRQWKQSTAKPSDDAIWVLQNWALLWLAATGIAAFMLIIVPTGLILLHWLPSAVGAARQLLLGFELAFIGTVVGAVWRLRRGVLKTTGAVLTTILTPMLILLPFLGITYWVTQKGVGWHVGLTVNPTMVFLVSVVVFLVMLFTDEVTSLPHMYYRERLATAFIGRRVSGPNEELGYNQPPWVEPIALSRLVRRPSGLAALPKLVVCAAVNLSGAVPLGRGGASFTFEDDFVGGPTTGYVRTRAIESGSGPGAVTMPALMAISGAAVSPSMGKMTRAGLRFAMALFDLRLGVWLPNPKRDDWESFSALEVWADRRAPASIRSDDTEAAAVFAAAMDSTTMLQRAFRRPGTKYVFYEAIGKNDLDEKHVYVTDGGHFDNIGMVELLRRGCGKLFVLDAAGDDIHHFNTLSEAIELAHADLGIEFMLDMEDLTPRSPARREGRDESGDEDKGEGRRDTSRRCFVKGTYAFPNGVIGQIVFVKAAICDDVPIEVTTYRERDPQFPSHPTTNQMFSELTFESYRTLGEHAVHEVFETGGPW